MGEVMNNVLIKVLIVLLLGLMGMTAYYKYDRERLKDQVATLANNNYAYEQEMLGYQDSLKRDRGVYQLTLDQIKHSKDSVLIKLNETRKELKIKDKELKEMTSFVASMKTDTTINITNIINDSCEFNLVVTYNPQTVFSIANKKVNGQDSLTHRAYVASGFKAYIYDRSDWREPNFFKRLFLFKWKKDKTERSVLVPDNDKLKVTGFKVIKVK